MVINHAQKKLARLVMKDSRGVASYTEAMERVKRLHQVSAREHQKRKLFTDGPVVEKAGAALCSGRDLIVFGMTFTGKSSAAYSAIESSGLSSLILEQDYQAAAAVRSIVADSVIVRSFDAEPLAAEKGVELVMTDDISISYHRHILEPQLKNAPRRLLVIHAQDRENALWRINGIFPGLTLNAPAFLESIQEQSMDSQASWRRSLRFYDEA